MQFAFHFYGVRAAKNKFVGTYFFNIPIFYMKSAADAGAKTAKKQSASQLRNTLCFSPSMRLIRLQYTP